MKNAHNISGAFREVSMTPVEYVKHQLGIYLRTIKHAHSVGMGPCEIVADILSSGIDAASGAMVQKPRDFNNAASCFTAVVTMNTAMASFLVLLNRNGGDMEKTVLDLPEHYAALGEPPASFTGETVQ